MLASPKSPLSAVLSLPGIGPEQGYELEEAGETGIKKRL